MASIGPIFPTLRANLTGSGSTAWSGAINIGADDSTTATCALPNLGTSNILCARYSNTTDFGIPAGSTINGIVVEVNDGSFPVAIKQVGLSKSAGTTNAPVAGTAKAASSGTGWVTYGSSSDLWGTTWTQAEIDSGNFAARITCQDAGDGGGTASVDAVRTTVYYTEPLTAVGSQRALPYAVKAEVGSQRALAFKVNSPVGDQRSIPYKIAAVVGSQRSLPYVVNAVVGAMRALAYKVMKEVGAQRAFPFYLGGSTGASLEFRYKVNLTPVSQKAGQPYKILVLAGAQRAIPFKIAGASGASVALPYEILIPRDPITWIGLPDAP